MRRLQYCSCFLFDLVSIGGWANENIATFDNSVIDEEEVTNSVRNVRAVDVGVGHDMMFVITHLSTLNSSRPMPQPAAVINVPHLSRGEHLSEARFLDVEDLPFRQKCCLAIYGALLRRAMTPRVHPPLCKFGQASGLPLWQSSQFSRKRNIQRAYGGASHGPWRAASRARAASIILPTTALLRRAFQRSRRRLVYLSAPRPFQLRGHQLVWSARRTGSGTCRNNRPHEPPSVVTRGC